MIEIPGFRFPVLASSDAGSVATAIARRTERGRAWMSDLFGFDPRPRLEVLDEADWARRAIVDLYGMPHFGEDGAIYVAAIDADLFAELVRLTLEDMPAGMRPVFIDTYGDPTNVRAFADLLALHELAHLYHAQAGFDFGRWWLRELFCNIALEGYVVEAEPAARQALETFPRAARHIRRDRMAFAGLDEMERAEGVHYGWYELRLHAAAIDIWAAGGRAALIDLYDRAKAAAAADRTMTVKDLHPSIANVAATWEREP